MGRTEKNARASVTGTTAPCSSVVGRAQAYLRPAKVVEGAGDRRLAPCVRTDGAGRGCTKPPGGRGVRCKDITGDGERDERIS